MHFLNVIASHFMVFPSVIRWVLYSTHLFLRSISEVRRSFYVCVPFILLYFLEISLERKKKKHINQFSTFFNVTKMVWENHDDMKYWAPVYPCTLPILERVHYRIFIRVISHFYDRTFFAHSFSLGETSQLKLAKVYKNSALNLSTPPRLQYITPPPKISLSKLNPFPLFLANI